MSSKSAVLPVLVFAAMMSSVISSLGMLLVPTVAEKFEVSLSAAQWMLTVNLLVGAIATPIMGRLSDGHRKRRLLITSLLVITAGAVIAATAMTFPVFLFGRALQGLAYGIVPITISLARRHLPPDRAQAGISMLSVTVSVGLGLGYPLTGLLADTAGFRWAFGFGTLFAFSAAMLVWKVIPVDTPPNDKLPRRRFDGLGAVLLGIWMLALLLTLSEGPNWGFRAPWIYLTSAGAVVGFWLWVVQELRTRTPLVNIRVFKRHDVLIANITALGMGISMYIAISIVSVMAQAPLRLGYGFELPLVIAGMVMLPLSIGSLGANRVLRILRGKTSLVSVLILGVVAVSASTWLLTMFHQTLWEVLLGMFVLGIGVGMTYAAMPALIHHSVAEEGLGSAVSFNQVLRTIGGSIGSALSGAMLAKYTHNHGFPEPQGIESALLMSTVGCSLIAMLLVINRFAQIWRNR